MYFDLKNTLKMIMSPVIINCLMILKEDDIQEEITSLPLPPLEYI